MQLNEFKKSIKLIKEKGFDIQYKSFDKSATSLLWKSSIYSDIARVGISSYGLWPSPHFSKLMGPK